MDPEAGKVNEAWHRHRAMLTRRGFLSAAAGLAALPVSSHGAPLARSRDADIVVVGAGAAGIAAARRIMGANRKVVVVEAGPQIGGRCITDQGTLDVAFDRGARWLHNPDGTIAQLVPSIGLEVAALPLGQRLRIGRRDARGREIEKYLAAVGRANRAIEEAARGKLDSSCATVLAAKDVAKDLGDFLGTVEFSLGAAYAGKDLKELSAIDKARAQDRNIALGCPQGLGTLIARFGEQIPVTLSAPVSRINWSGREVAVETPTGRIAARAAIVTVSTNVLTSGDIRFSPELPRRTLDAAAKLGLGSYDHIMLQLSGNPLGLAPNDLLIEQSDSTRTGLLFANIEGTSLCSLDVGGSFGRDLSAQGEQAMADFAREWISRLFGGAAGRAVKSVAATRWNAAPYVKGAMSAATPGGQMSRRILTEPLGNLFLAGEATHETLWGTVEGAWESGLAAAEAALRRIGALAD
ncbi:MAG: FAD-dependent oxidoreductase [Alphaproteobacteria bacterium]|nr:FAD-dependent oxidoreductase [Alphaproteobacteria bacterium]